MPNKHRIIPMTGTTYQNKNGTAYKCIAHVDGGGYVMQSLEKSGWTCEAHGIWQYDNGEIEWDYSCNGYFVKESA